MIHCNQDDGDDEECNGGDPMFSSNPADLGIRDPGRQLCAVHERAVTAVDAPPAATSRGRRAACYTLTLATAYRMLFGHRPHILKPGDNVLVWGASGGLGSYAIQLMQHGRRERPSQSSRTRTKRDFVLWPRRERRAEPQGLQLLGATAHGEHGRNTRNGSPRPRKFGKAIWDITGKGNNVDMVFEHPGEATMPVSTFRGEEVAGWS